MSFDCCCWFTTIARGEKGAIWAKKTHWARNYWLMNVEDGPICSCLICERGWGKAKYARAHDLTRNVLGRKRSMEYTEIGERERRTLSDIPLLEIFLLAWPSTTILHDTIPVAWMTIIIKRSKINSYHWHGIHCHWPVAVHYCPWEVGSHWPEYNQLVIHSSGDTVPSWRALLVRIQSGVE